MQKFMPQKFWTIWYAHVTSIDLYYSVKLITQVHPYCRPTAEVLLTLDFFTQPFCKLPASVLGCYTYV